MQSTLCFKVVHVLMSISIVAVAQGVAGRFFYMPLDVYHELITTRDAQYATFIVAAIALHQPHQH